MLKALSIKLFVVILLTACLSVTASTAQLLLNDTLKESTKGTRSGGEFADGGWKVTGQRDFIYWHLPRTVSKGAAEFSIKGLSPNESRDGMKDKSELFHMYDYTWHNSDTQYGDPGYRNNPFKHFIRKIGCLGSYNNSIDANEVVWAITPNYFESDTPVLSWDPKKTYRFREEWGPDGKGNSILKLYRDGVQILDKGVVGDYAPAGHSVRIAASTWRAEDSGAPIGAVYSNIKVWDLSADTP